MCFIIFLLAALLPYPARAQINTAVKEATLAAAQIITFDRNYQINGSGSGAVISAGGLVLTNYHVIADNRAPDKHVGIRLPTTLRADQYMSYSAAIVATDPQLDLAILKIDQVYDTATEKALPLSDDVAFATVVLGNSNAVETGDEVYALGYPNTSLGSFALTKGLISGFVAKEDKTWLLSDVEASHGNSGGLLVNLQGELIGVPTQVQSDSDVNASLLYALPINEAQPLIEAAMDHNSTSVVQSSLALKADEAILFEDTFDNNENGWALGESDNEYNLGMVEITQGQLQIRDKFKQTSGTRSYIPNLKARNFALRVDAQLVERSGNENYTNLFFAFGEDSEGNFQQILFSESGYVSVAAWLNEEWVTMQEWKETDAFHIRPGENVSLVMAVSGNRLTAYANNEQVLEFEAETIGQLGRISLGISAPKGQDVLVSFDNLLVSEGGSTSATKETTTDELKVLFEDTFDNNENGWGLVESNDEYGRRIIEIGQGQLQLQGEFEQGALTWIPVPNLKVRNFTLHVDVQLLERSGNENYTYLSFAFGEDSEGNFSSVSFSESGYIRVDAWLNKEWVIRQEWTKTNAFQLQVGEAVNLGIAVSGNLLTVYANDQQVLMFEDETIGQLGQIRLGLSAPKSQTVVAAFDNMVIQEVPVLLQTADVVVRSLNVHDGPGRGYRLVDTVQQGERLIIKGRLNRCTWLKVETPNGIIGWVLGATRYVTLNSIVCTDIPETPR